MSRSCRYTLNPVLSVIKHGWLTDYFTPLRLRSPLGKVFGKPVSGPKRAHCNPVPGQLVRRTRWGADARAHGNRNKHAQQKPSDGLHNGERVFCVQKTTDSGTTGRRRRQRRACRSSRGQKFTNRRAVVVVAVDGGGGIGRQRRRSWPDVTPPPTCWFRDRPSCRPPARRDTTRARRGRKPIAGRFVVRRQGSNWKEMLSRYINNTSNNYYCLRLKVQQ